MGNTTKISFLVSKRLGLHGFEEKEERAKSKRKRMKKKEEEKKIKVWNSYFFSGLDMNPKVFGWRLVSPLV